MRIICPKPKAWSRIYQALMRYSKNHPCVPPEPPRLLILGGWAFSSDGEKAERWQETIDWAERNNCASIAADVHDGEYYGYEEPSDEVTGWQGRLF